MRLPRRFARSASRFRHETKAATAVEFALVGLPFCLVMFVIMETGLISYVQSTLDDVATSAARQIMTGQVQSGQIPGQSSGARLNGSGFRKTVICPKLSALLDCDRVTVNVFAMAETRVGSNVFFTSEGELIVSTKDGERICPGKPGELAYLQISYAMPAITSQLSPAIRNGAGTHVIVSGRPIKNEPYTVNLLGGSCAS
ncbi:MAG: hypothetical protein JWL93_2887 [Hyphomicrobiales bacterium]|nr:hypothetical protein [Hyphomicrobiales bacterium]